MRYVILPVCAVAFLVLAGCSGRPIMAGRPGALVTETEPDYNSYVALQADPGEPAFCVATVVGPYAKGDYLERVLSELGFRDLRPRSQDRAGCDVLLHLGKDGETTLANAWIKAHSAYTGEPLWEARGKGGFGQMIFPGLGRALRLAFQPGRPVFQQLVESKAKAPTAGASAPAAASTVPEIVSDVDEPPSAAASRIKGHAVIIGVSRYRQALPRADFADRDARTMARYAKAVLGYPEENVTVLVDDGRRAATSRSTWSAGSPTASSRRRGVRLLLRPRRARPAPATPSWSCSTEIRHISMKPPTRSNAYTPAREAPGEVTTVALDSLQRRRGGARSSRRERARWSPS